MLLSDENMHAYNKTTQRWEEDFEPTIDAGTGAPAYAKEILTKLTNGWYIGDIVRSCHLEGDTELSAAISYAETLPPDSFLAQLLKQYRENRKRQIWMVLEDLKQALLALYGEGLVQLILFGSQARGDAMPDSDIDVLVVLKGSFHWLTESDRISQLVADLSLHYTELLNCVLMDETTFVQQTEPLLVNIRQEGIRV